MANRIGNELDNLLTGTINNDLIDGFGGNDTLDGAGSTFDNNEIEILKGGFGADLFILGDSVDAYYLNPFGFGEDSFAIIEDFFASEGDRIQLFGNINDYTLENTFQGGVDILYKGDLIGNVANTTDVFLDRDFVFLAPPLSSKTDFNKDGKTDVLWRNNQAADTRTWFLDGVTNPSRVDLIGQEILPPVGADWEVLGVSDLNQDFNTDIVWRNRINGDVRVWLMDGTLQIGGAQLPFVGIDWEIAGFTDFDNNQSNDILWRNTQSGRNLIWLMDGTNPTNFAELPSVGLDWVIVGVGDFDNQGSDDILWHNKVTAETRLWSMNGTNITASRQLFNVGIEWEGLGVADFNNDSNNDIAWRNTLTGETVIYFMNGFDYQGQTSLGNIGADWQMFV